MSLNVPNPKFQAFDTSTGAFLVGGKVYSYEPGLATPKKTYSDNALLVENTNPIILDARGEGTIYLSGSTDLTLKTAADVTIWGPITVSVAASVTSAGIIELATNAECQTGTDTSRAVTPAGLASVTATETRAGLVERATDAEAIAMADTSRYTTPAHFALLTFSTLKFAKISDTKANNTAGGTFTSGAWQTRNLNTEDSDVSDIISITANQFNLATGTYWLIARAPAYAVNQHKTRIQNVTDGTTALLGSNAYAPAASNSQTDSTVMGLITIAAAKTFGLQHYCTTTNADDGYGIASNYSVNEVYSEVLIWKVS